MASRKVYVDTEAVYHCQAVSAVWCSADWLPMNKSTGKYFSELFTRFRNAALVTEKIEDFANAIPESASRTGASGKPGRARLMMGRKREATLLF